MKKCITIFCFWLFITNITPIFAKYNNDWEKTYRKFSEKEKKQWEICIEQLMKHSSLGYVLFGNKPIYFTGFCNVFPVCLSNCSSRFEDIFIKEFIHLLEKHNLIRKGKNHFVQIQYNKFQQGNQSYSYVLVINKKAFYKVVNKHLLLFQYVLGPQVTPKKLLKKISDPNETIFSALDNDVTLVGLVLGYGGHNANIYAYKSRINSFLRSEKENLPLKSHKLFTSEKFTNKTQFFPHYNDKLTTENIYPSFGYLSLKEEKKDLQQRTTISSDIEKNDLSPTIPNFGCIPNKATKDIIKKYKETQKNIIAILSSNQILERVFAAFDGKEMLNIKNKKTHTNIKNPAINDYSDFIVQLVRHSSSVCYKKPDKYLKQYLAGLKSTDNPTRIDYTWYKQSKKIISTQRKIEAKKNLIQADKYFSDLSKNLSLQTIEPKKLYYKQENLGTGKKIVSYGDTVTIYYHLESIKTKYIPKNNIGIQKDKSLDQFIPGLAKILLGMKKNEKRIGYIHPSYAYGEKTSLPPNLGWKVEVKLIDINKSIEKTHQNFSAYKLKAYYDDLKLLKQDLSKLHYEKEKFKGINNQKFFQNIPQISIPKIIKKLQQTNKTEINFYSDDTQQKLSDLYWLLYTHKEKIH